MSEFDLEKIMNEFDFKEAIKDWDKRELVKFNLFCCYKVKHLMNKESLETVELVERWIEDKYSVSNEELKKLALAAINAANCDDYAAAYAAYYTVKATHATTQYTFVVYTAYNAYYTAEALDTSKEALYLNYMREKLSNIMES